MTPKNPHGRLKLYRKTGQGAGSTHNTSIQNEAKKNGKLNRVILSIVEQVYLLGRRTYKQLDCASDDDDVVNGGGGEEDGDSYRVKEKKEDEVYEAEEENEEKGGDNNDEKEGKSTSPCRG